MLVLPQVYVGGWWKLFQQGLCRFLQQRKAVKSKHVTQVKHGGRTSQGWGAQVRRILRSRGPVIASERHDSGQVAGPVNPDDFAVGHPTWIADHRSPDPCWGARPQGGVSFLLRGGCGQLVRPDHAGMEREPVRHDFLVASRIRPGPWSSPRRSSRAARPRGSAPCGGRRAGPSPRRPSRVDAGGGDDVAELQCSSPSGVVVAFFTSRSWRLMIVASDRRDRCGRRRAVGSP